MLFRIQFRLRSIFAPHQYTLFSTRQIWIFILYLALPKNVYYIYSRKEKGAAVWNRILNENFQSIQTDIYVGVPWIMKTFLYILAPENRYWNAIIPKLWKFSRKPAIRDSEGNRASLLFEASSFEKPPVWINFIPNRLWELDLRKPISFYGPTSPHFLLGEFLPTRPVTF